MFIDSAGFDHIRLPIDEEQIPFHLTHYQVSWTRLKDFVGEVNYPGQIVLNGTLPEEKRLYNLDTLEKMMQKPFHLADSLDLPLYCGEFGGIEKSP